MYFQKTVLIWIKANACFIKEDNLNQHFFNSRFVKFFNLKLYYKIWHNSQR